MKTATGFFFPRDASESRNENPGLSRGIQSRSGTKSKHADDGSGAASDHASELDDSNVSKPADDGACGGDASGRDASGCDASGGDAGGRGGASHPLPRRGGVALDDSRFGCINFVEYPVTAGYEGMRRPRHAGNGRRTGKAKQSGQE
ncbi:hypothetical protein [Mesorhizobium sp. WSM2239]|uniref:Uncharacterized protein n=2 Tax=unclassified Mesorhizobium TaxID=325217 RepID=A0AAU8D6U3_9HYPH